MSSSTITHSEPNTLVLISSIDMRLILKMLTPKSSTFFPLRVKCIFVKLINIICVILNMELTLALWGGFWFDTNYRTMFSSSLKIVIDILIGTAFSSMDILKILIPQIHEHGMLLLLLFSQ